MSLKYVTDMTVHSVDLPSNGSVVAVLQEPWPANFVGISSFPVFYHEEQLSYDTNFDPPKVRGGTILALVERLTRPDKLDASFNHSFLLTYSLFSNASEIFELLTQRFNVEVPAGLVTDQYDAWAEKKQRPTRFRVVNILKSWLDHYWVEDESLASKDLLQRFLKFLKNSAIPTKTPGVGQLVRTVEERLEGRESRPRLVPTLNTSMPPPIIPIELRPERVRFLDIDVTEFARQLTIIESRLYCKISPVESLARALQVGIPADKSELPSNIKTLILHSTQLTNWVAEFILAQNDPKKRVILINRFSAIAEVSL